ncbi:MAG TPA: MFS transporter [Steroidobacter sp.]|uniref:MFS transporter n=1 Tax=Steroidobacter sp. TaxID=1978227 RepID=UPI002ED9D0E4
MSGVTTRVLQQRAGAFAVLLASFAGFVCLGLPDGTLSVAWPSLRDDFARRQADYGMVLLVHGTSYFLNGLLGARLNRRFKPHALLIAASLISASGMLLIAAAPRWWMFLTGIALIACGAGILNTTINTYASQHFSPRHVNWLHACYSLGAAVGPLAMTAVMTRHASWQWGYVLIALAPLTMVAVYVRTASLWQYSLLARERAAAAPSKGFNPLLVRQAILFFCYSGLEQTLGRWCYTVLTELKGTPVATAGLVASCYFGSIFAGRLLLGAALDRVGATRMVRVGSIVAVVGTSGFAVGDGPVAALGLVLAGIALAPIFPTLIAQSAARFPKLDLARVIATCVASAILGSAAAPYLAGMATRTFGLGAIALVALVLAILLLTMHESIARYPTSKVQTQ